MAGRAAVASTQGETALRATAVGEVHGYITATRAQAHVAFSRLPLHGRETATESGGTAPRLRSDGLLSSLPRWWTDGG